MIILKTLNDKSTALRPSGIVAVEEHPETPEISAVIYILNRQSKKTNTIMVKHTVQEVVDALNKVESWL
jgi:uncharacterized protein YlzI (FlbEa/FlbD family)